MGLLEDELRSTFAAAVRITPAVDDAAGRSIAQAGRQRRRRVATTAAAVAVVLVAGGAGAVALSDRAGRTGNGGASTPTLTVAPSPQPPQPPARPPVDVLAGARILTAEGSLVSLAQLPPAQRAYRIRESWLVETWDASARRSALWRVTAGGSTRLVEGRRISVSPDGTRVAWSEDDSVSVGGIAAADASATPVTGVKTTSGTAGFFPLAFVAGGVLMGRTQTGGGIDTYDMWFPSRGIYAPGPRRTEKTFGPNAAGTLLYGLDGAAGCLAEISPETLRPVRTACVSRLTVDDTLYPSPDGHWLLVAGPDGLDLYDLSAVWTRPEPTESWPRRLSTVAWYDGQTIVGSGPTGELCRIFVGSRVVENLGFSDNSTTVSVVPRLG